MSTRYTRATGDTVSAARWRPCNNNCSCPLHAQIHVSAPQSTVRTTLEYIDTKTFAALRADRLIHPDLYTTLCNKLGYPETGVEAIAERSAPESTELVAIFDALFVAAVKTAARVGRFPGFSFVCTDGQMHAHIDAAGFVIS